MGLLCHLGSRHTPRRLRVPLQIAVASDVASDFHSAPGLQGRRRYINIQRQRSEWGTTPRAGSGGVETPTSEGAFADSNPCHRAKHLSRLPTEPIVLISPPNHHTTTRTSNYTALNPAGCQLPTEPLSRATYTNLTTATLNVTGGSRARHLSSPLTEPVVLIIPPHHHTTISTSNYTALNPAGCQLPILLFRRCQIWQSG